MAIESAIDLPEPEDAPARRRIRDDLGSTLFVQAAAGSGKTSALVARVTSLIDHGLAELREIAAISFTEAAATELRGRVAVALATPPGADAPPRAAERRLAALLQLDESAMTTIHGFTQRLLAEDPLDAGLPLRFEVVDELVATVTREERFAGFIDRLFDDPASGDLLRAATVLGIGVNPLQQIARQMSDRFDGLDLPAARATIPELVRARAARIRDAARACRPFGGRCTDEGDRLRARLVRLDAALSSAPGEADGWLSALEWLMALPAELKASGGRRASWPDGEIEVARGAVLAYEGERTEAIAALYDAVLSGIGRAMLSDAAQFAADRRASGTLFFHDLLVIAHDLLVDNIAVRREVRDRYAYVLVDEFQDTDPIQLEILGLLGTEPGATEPDAGRLFFVGDPMQSIYRFRGADVSLFRSTRERIGPTGVVNLTTNFRSAPGICAFVATTFAPLVDVADAASVTLRPFREDGAGTRVWSIGQGSDELLAPQRRSEEAADVVAAIAALVASGAPVVTPDGIRPARFGDVAVLVPNRAGLGTLLRAFARAGIDVHLNESALIYGSPEVSEVLAVAAAVDDRGDDRAVIGALRTGLFAISDRELRQHVECGGTWELGAAADRRRMGAPGVLAAIGELRALRDARTEHGPVGIVTEMLDRLQVREIAAASDRGRDAVRRLDFLVDRARACRDHGGRTLRDLLRFFELERRLGTRIAAPPTEEDDAAAVRIMTVHGAKGLEFPIVVLAELGGAIGSKPRTPALLVHSGRVEISLGSGRATAGYGDLAAAEAAAEREQAIRLAYVAATRARDYLVVSLHHPVTNADEPGSIAAIVARALDLPVAPMARARLAAVSSRAEAVPPLDRESYDAYVDRWERTVSAARRPRSVTPSALETPVAPRVERPRAAAAPDRDEGDGTDWRRARASSSIGRAVHAVLQRIDLVDPTELQLLSERFATLEGCGEFVDVVASLALAATRAPIVREAAASASLHRELPITLPTEDGFVEGVVDLCFAGPSGLVIVDYKTDVAADAEEAAVRAERYRLQAGAYAWAVGAITGRSVERVVFLFLAPPDGSIEIVVDDVDGVIADAQSAVALAMARTGTGLDHDRGR